MVTRAAWIFSGVVILTAACDDADDRVGFEDDVVYELRDAVSNGWWLNSWWLNSWWLNGTYLDGSKLTASGTTDFVQAVEFLYEDAVAKKVWLEGSQLFVMTASGTVVSGGAMNKLKLKYDVKQGGEIKKKTLRISHAQPLVPGSDVWVYDIDGKVDGGPWTSVCVDHEGVATQAILLGEVWSGTTGTRVETSKEAMTYACRGTALAKCVEWGYKPWTSASGTALDDYHQACSRMVRADYCGTGTPHTVTGTAIHVLDGIGIQNVAPDTSYVVEAEWDADGATCLNSANTRLPDQNIECSLPACGTSFSSGGIIQSGKIASP